MRIEQAEFVRSCVSARDCPADGLPEVAFAGRSNVGKSSLINRLLGRTTIARVSRTPGRTRAANFFRVNRRFYFVDLPGFGYARTAKSEREKWAVIVEEVLRRPGSRKLVVQLVDGNVGATPLDVEARRYFESLPLTPIVVATKIDRVGRSGRRRALEGVSAELNVKNQDAVFAVSAESGEGVRELWKRIAAFLAGEIPPRPTREENHAQDD